MRLTTPLKGPPAALEWQSLASQATGDSGAPMGDTGRVAVPLAIIKVDAGEEGILANQLDRGHVSPFVG